MTSFKLACISNKGDTLHFDLPLVLSLKWFRNSGKKSANIGPLKSFTVWGLKGRGCFSISGKKKLKEPLTGDRKGGC